jgi:hypothetical protein
MGGGAHAGAPAAGAAGGAAAGADGVMEPCRSRSAEPEITRVNSPGPLDAGAAGSGAILGGTPVGAEGNGCAGGGALGNGAACGGAAELEGVCMFSDCSICVNPPAAAGAAGASGGGGAAGAGVDGGVESVCSNCVNPPAAAGVEPAAGIGANGAGSAGFAADSWFNACINCVNPPFAAGEVSMGRAGDSLNGKPDCGSAWKGLNGSGCGAGAELENMLVNEPGAELRGGSGCAGADGAAPNEAPV